MSEAYSPTWVTDQLAVGPAPMSHAQLDSLRNAGIMAIMNLCGEYIDLHDIERAAGFEVYHMPLADEEAPELAELEKALAWLDEAIYLGKKVLIHCRHGIGRTGTVLNAYLLRRGLGHRLSWLKLRKLRSRPANFNQWRTIRRYGKKSPKLTVREPSLEMHRAFDLGPLFREYEVLLEQIDAKVGDHSGKRCGQDHDLCCRTPVSVTLVEAAYLTHGMNARLTSETRLEIINLAVETSRRIRTTQSNAESQDNSLTDADILCPLNRSGVCILPSCRPLQCRTFAWPKNDAGSFQNKVLEPEAGRLSLELWYAIAGCIARKDLPRFHLSDVVSGRYVQTLFHLMTGKS